MKQLQYFHLLGVQGKSTHSEITELRHWIAVVRIAHWLGYHCTIGDYPGNLNDAFNSF